jgi:hypothetical protein
VTTAKTRNGASKTTSKIDDKNRIDEQFISSQLFYRTPGGRVQKITVKKRFKPRIIVCFIRRLKRFTATQKFIHKQSGQEKRALSRSYQTNQPGQEQASAHYHTQPGQNQIWPGSELAMGKSKHTQQEAALGENLSGEPQFGKTE